VVPLCNITCVPTSSMFWKAILAFQNILHFGTKVVAHCSVSGLRSLFVKVNRYKNEMIHIRLDMYDGCLAERHVSRNSGNPVR
jgi:hypothetical protein